MVHQIVTFFLVTFCRQLHLSQAYDYFFNANSASSYKTTFGCSTTGCSVSPEWRIYGTCYNPTLTLEVMETDYYSTSSEYVDVYINSIYQGVCNGPDQDCVYNFTSCTNFDNYDLSSFVSNSGSSSFSDVTIQLDASSGVNICAHNGYYLFARAIFTCDGNSSDTWINTFNYTGEYETTYSTDYSMDVGSAGVGSVTGILSCTTAGCSDTISFGIRGKCDDATLTVTVVETDYASSVETAFVYINGAYIASCEPLGMCSFFCFLYLICFYVFMFVSIYNTADEDCTYTFQKCDNVDGYDLSSYLDLPYVGSWDSIEIGVTISSDVNICGYSSIYYLYAYAQITCGNNATSNVVTEYVDYSMNVGSSGVGSVTGIISCTSAGCSDTISVGIRGKCDDPQLTLTIVETDFADSTEYAYVYINGGYVASCEPLSMYCTKLTK